MEIATVVVTYRRPLVLAETLAAISEQSTPQAMLVVVDNGPHFDSQVRRIVQEVGGEYLWAGKNVGYGAGIAIGIERARELLQPDGYWVMDDDSIPANASLALLISELTDDVGIVANRGGHVKFGRIRHTLGAASTTQRADADFTLIDGALVAAAVVDAVGLPRTDLFMMLEDFEYTTRAKAAGFRLVVVAGDQSEHRHMGAAASWRSYYQARNLLRIAIDRRSPSLLLGWATREAAIFYTLLRSRQFDKVKLRAHGAYDALRGRMGHTVGLP